MNQLQKFDKNFNPDQVQLADDYFLESMYAKLSLLGEYTPQHVKWGNSTKRKGKGFAKKRIWKDSIEDVDTQKEIDEDEDEEEIEEE